jgi:hypothetical protein
MTLLLMNSKHRVARHAGLLGQYGDLDQRLDDDAEEDVVADLAEAGQFALADIADAATESLEIADHLVIGLFRSRGDDAQLAGLDHLAVSADRRSKEGRANPADIFARLRRRLL